jgi:prepilin-type N-terminal cleavage/methylation domain-containing protein
VVLGLLSRECRKAFTLIELLLTLIITGMAISAVALSFSNYLKDQKTQQITIASTTYPIAPAWSQLKAAMELHLDFREDLLGVSSIFVLGGEYENGSSVQAAPGMNILPTVVPSITTVSQLDSTPGSFMNSATQFRDLLDNSKAFVTCNDQDFTVFMLGHPLQDNKTTVLSIAVVRSFLSDGYRVYDVKYYRNTSGSAMTLSDSYSFAIEESMQQDFELRVGAKHVWGHENSTWAITEEMGCKVVFPDPTALPRKASTTVDTFSRFVYYLPVKQ